MDEMQVQGESVLIGCFYQAPPYYLVSVFVTPDSYPACAARLGGCFLKDSGGLGEGTLRWQADVR